MARFPQSPGIQKHIRQELMMAGVGSGEWRAGELVRARDEKKRQKKKSWKQTTATCVSRSRP